MNNQIALPSGTFSGKTERSQKRDHEQYTAFAKALQGIQTAVNKKLQDAGEKALKMGARDWCYLLEEHGLKKPEFDRAEKRIGFARKRGYLPVDFTLEDGTRSADGDHGAGNDYPVEKELEFIWNSQIQGHLNGYCPINWFDYQPYYIELLVEKKGLASLFLETCKDFHVSLSNGRGDTDIISVAKMHRRFQEAEQRGQKPLLLYFGDFDPKGLLISDILPRRFDGCAGQWFEDGTILKPLGLEIQRIGLNLETIEKLNLSKIPNLLTGAKQNIMCTDGVSRPPGKVPLDNEWHPDHSKPYVQNYLDAIAGHPAPGSITGWKVEANAIIVRPLEGIAMLKDALMKYIDPYGVKAYEEALADIRGDLRKALPDFLKGKLAA